MGRWESHLRQGNVWALLILACTVQLTRAGEETGAGIQPPESKGRAAVPVNCNCTEVEEWALMISAQTLFCPSISTRDRRFKVPVSELCTVLSYLEWED